jgi:7,8-dihydropterin-6-yl-methyl-4-(beta-D-ribofuranosyl)aminobenzene 5'-phosphate synthase
MQRILQISLALLLVPPASPSKTVPPRPQESQAKAVQVTLLSTMLSGNPSRGIGEWGFAALLEIDGRRILIDTGERPETVLRNAQELGIDLATVTDVVLTHNHWDHVGGLVVLRRELAKRNPTALARAHVAPGIFQSRREPGGQEANGLLPLRAAYEASGGTFVEHSAPTELMPGVWFTGPVPRPHQQERNWSRRVLLQGPAGAVEDTIPEDASVVVDTQDGLIIIAGCGHAGIINTAEYARRVVRQAPLHAVVGGLHLFAATDAQVGWTATKLREFGLSYLLGAHCTGIEATYRLRELIGLTRKTAVVGAVGASFTLGKGLDPLALAG